MTEINVVVTGPEEAYNNEAEFWRGGELIGITVLHEGRVIAEGSVADVQADPQVMAVYLGSAEVAA